MAELHVEKKKRSIWPWLLLLLIIAVAVWAVVTFAGDRIGLHTQADAPASAPVAQAATAPPARAS